MFQEARGLGSRREECDTRVPHGDFSGVSEFVGTYTPVGVHRGVCVCVCKVCVWGGVCMHFHWLSFIDGESRPALSPLKDKHLTIAELPQHR